jgi:hypothetical protein
MHSARFSIPAGARSRCAEVTIVHHHSNADVLSLRCRKFDEIFDGTQGMRHIDGVWCSI